MNGKKHTALAATLAGLLVVALVIWVRYRDSEFVCPSPDGDNSICSSRANKALLAKAWGAYAADVRGHMDARYYRFRVKKGVPAHGQVTIEIGPNNKLLQEELHTGMFGGGAYYVYDVEADRIVKRAFDK